MHKHCMTAKGKVREIIFMSHVLFLFIYSFCFTFFYSLKEGGNQVRKRGGKGREGEKREEKRQKRGKRNGRG